jgi:hypothetical protein
MQRLRRSHAIQVGALALLVSHCGGGVASGGLHGGDAGVDAFAGDAGFGDAGSCEGTAGQNGPPGLPTEHRPTAAACPRTPLMLAPDAGSLSCNSDQDCQGDAGTAELHCAEHLCGYDTCLTDSDCSQISVGTLCVCNANAGDGTRSPGNVCVPAACHVDADCGQGNECTPSRGRCGDVSGFYCTSSQDTCVDPTRDCACGGNSCVYAPTVGHFLCATNTCNG